MKTPDLSGCGAPACQIPTFVAAKLVAVLAWHLLSAHSATGQASAGIAVAWGEATNTCGVDVVAVAVGYDHDLLLNRDGMVSMCGNQPFISGVPIVLPDHLPPFVAVATSWHTNYGLLENGTVMEWDLISGETRLVPGLSNVAAISASSTTALALRRDGTVALLSKSMFPPPEGLSNVVEIAAGSPSSAALLGDGHVLSWGYWNTNMSQFTEIVGVAGGYFDLLGLKADGTIVGEGDYAPPPALTGVRDIACSSGNDHHLNMAVLSDGTVRAWGHNFFGTKWPPDPEENVPADLVGVVAVAGGASHNVALVGGGPPFIIHQPLSRNSVMEGSTAFRVRATGAFPLGYQWKHNGTDIPGANLPWLRLTNLQPVDAGAYSVVIRNDYGVVSSQDSVLQLDPLRILQQPANAKVAWANPVSFDVTIQGFKPLRYQWHHEGAEIPGATNRILSIPEARYEDSGAYMVIAANDYGSISSMAAHLVVEPIHVRTQPKSVVSYRGGSAGFSVEAEGRPPMSYQWLFNGVPLPGETGSTLGLSNLNSLEAGGYHVVISNVAGVVTSTPALLDVSSVVSWGGIPQSMVPRGLSNVLAIAASESAGLALTSDRRVSAWGGAYSQIITNVPPEATNIIAIFTGGYANPCQALRADGSILAWGIGFPLAQGTNVVAISPGDATLWLESDGKVRVEGTGPAARVPAHLSNNAVAVATGVEHSMALGSDGRVFSWGTGPAQPAPSDLTNVVAISSFFKTAMALRSDGTVRVWGDGYYYGQTNVPSGLSNVVRIACGYACMALKADGTVTTWGGNTNFGQTTIPPGLTNVTAIATSGAHCMALLGEGPPILHALSSDAAIRDGNFSIRIPTESGRVYRLEYFGEDSRWAGLMLAAGTGEPIVLRDSSPLTRQRLYRVRSW